MFRRLPRRFRLLMMWLVALALPMQGIAAVTMLHCDHLNAAHGAHRAMAMDAGTHHHDHSAHGAHKTAATDKAGCSACAACCLGAVITAPPIVLPPPLAAVSVLQAANEPAWVGSILALPERPPRPRLA